MKGAALVHKGGLMETTVAKGWAEVRLEAAPTPSPLLPMERQAARPASRRL